MSHCGPPYNRGSGSWCGCRCNCCLPDFCDGSVRFIYHLGCNSSSSTACCVCPTKYTVILDGFDDSCSSSDDCCPLTSYIATVSGFDQNCSSSSACPCTAIVTLVPECKIEISDGKAYAIGSQFINYTLSDPCGAIATVKINGSTPPTYVLDGIQIVVTITMNTCYTLCSAEGPTCYVAAFTLMNVGGQLRLFRRVPKRKKKKRRSTK